MDIMEIINVCNDKVMSLTELYEDPSFGKIPHEQLREYIKSAMSIGRDAAIAIKNAYSCKSVRDLCKEKGVSINIYDSQYRVMKIQYRAEIYYTKKQINIMKPSIELMFNQLKELALLLEYGKDLTLEDIIDIHIAHELYHFIEYTENRETGELLPKVTTFKIGSFEKKSKLAKASEVAAHSFCKEFLELPFHPKLLDYLYLLKAEEVKEDVLIKYLTTLEDMLKV